MEQYKIPNTGCEIRKIIREGSRVVVESKTPSNGTFIAVFDGGKFKFELSKVIRTDSEGQTVVY